MDELSSDARTLVRIKVHSGKVLIIDAVCINCNKRINRCEQSALEELDTSCLKYDNLTELKLYIAFNYYDL
jgi:hypothetical protein